MKREAPALSPEKENKNREAQVLPSPSALPPQNNALEEFAFATTIQALESLGSLHESVVVTPRDVFPVSYSARSLDKSQEEDEPSLVASPAQKIQVHRGAPPGSPAAGTFP